MKTDRRSRCAVLGALLLALCAGASVSGAEEGAAPAERPVKKIKMYAENWKWTPKEIRVERGSLLSIDFQNYDAPHSFEIKELGIEVALPEGQTAHAEFVVDKPGVFKWRCGRPCGNGCPKMRGKLIVE